MQPGKKEVARAYAAVYSTTPAGSWEGRVADLHISVSGPTLEDARDALQLAVEAHVDELTDLGGLPDGIAPRARTVADRMDVNVYVQFSGKRWIAATSQPSRAPVRNPYVDRQGAPLLRESVVMVIDELGATSRMVDKLTAEVIGERAELLARAREWLGEDRTDEFESVVVYTDNLVHGAPIMDAEDATTRLGFTLSAASHYQFELALGGTILRGGITVGMHHQSPAIVAGPALIEAHLLESQRADVPRVLLSTGALELVARGLAEYKHPVDSPWVAQLLMDQDGLTFVSYLNASDEYDRGWVDQQIVLRQHRDRVREGLRQTKGTKRPHEKWRWLAAYHDYYIRAEGLPRTLRIRRFRGWRRKFEPILSA